MKFNDGYWKRKKGIDFQTPVEIRSMEKRDDSLLVYSSTKPVPHRGETINATLITTQIFTIAPNVIGVRHYHWRGRERTLPEFQLLQQQCRPEIQIEKEKAIFTSGDTRVEVTTVNGWTMRFYRDDTLLTGTTRKDMGYITAQEDARYMKEQLSLGVGEYVYGLGERFTHFVKNGQVIDLWNADGGTSSEQAYKNVPFYVTSKGYGVFVNHLEQISVECASEVVTGVGFSVPGEVLEYYVLGGRDLKETVALYCAMTGMPALPPAWSFGLWLTPSFSIDYDADTIRGFVEGMRERDVPLGVFSFDSFYQREYQFCDFDWDPQVFPDPQGLMDELKHQGLKTAIWINPYISQKSPLFAEGMERGYFIRNRDGSVYQVDWWMPGNAIVDFTNPAACDWYASYLHRLMDMGINAFKTDFGEMIPTENVLYHDGSDPLKMHNYYAYLYNQVVYQAVAQHDGKSEAMVFARSATAGSQRYPIHWAGDSYSSYESMAETLRGGLSLSLGGFGFWSHDISGFEKTATPDLYKRWTAFGLLSTHSRLHGSESFRVPWLFGEEAVDVLRHFVKLKCRLMPYLYAASIEAAQTGIPVMRPMLMEFAQDHTCKTIDTQYMLGEHLLVAPIFNGEGLADYYLPDGAWTDFLTGEKKEGGSYRLEKMDYFHLPLLVRPNSIIAVGAVDNRPDYDYADEVRLHVFQLTDQAQVTVYATDAGLDLALGMKWENGVIRVDVAGRGKPYQLVFHGGRPLQYGNERCPCVDGVVTVTPNPADRTYSLQPY